MKEKLLYVGKFLFLILLFAILFSYAMFQGGFVSWFLFYAFLPFLIYMTALLLYPLSDWKVTRRPSKRLVEAGDSVVIELEAHRSFPFPLYYMTIEESFPDTLQREDRAREKFVSWDEPVVERTMKQVLFPWFQKTFRLRYRLEHVPRGDHHFGSVRVRTGDFFGFVRKEWEIDSEGQFLVYPSKRKVSFSLHSRAFEQGATASRSFKEKQSNMVAGLREYAPGDRMSWVDWKATARKNKMMTKEFEQEKSSESFLILNGITNEGPSVKFEGAIEFAYSLLHTLSRQSQDLSFLSIGNERRLVPAIHSERQREMIRYHLAKLQPDETGDFPKEIAKEHTSLPKQAVLMIVSATFDSGIKESLLRLAPYCKQLLFFVVTPEEEWTFENQKLAKELRDRGVYVKALTEKEWAHAEMEVKA
ncbi:DUF58 domain-containing protein [Salimicrobium halophilum]|uniref:Uncharacterized conserved protein, DUF58 family, contains vWF domain n=1 Tax=Salimicrobium halophilum TaxID=86666 RepID=A0A1G8UFJ8_9BACI|nr:DUF58 domain-containing protein [Salimicrobium halophilum]SDJ52404.1 Uncharacterized conserved protein, DUF58 family, contains vWF domain [Salimicrobium halophilum]